MTEKKLEQLMLRLQYIWTLKNYRRGAKNMYITGVVDTLLAFDYSRAEIQNFINQYTTIDVTV